MRDRLDALATFVAVAEQRSFAEAARQLGRSSASVTRAVAALDGLGFVCIRSYQAEPHMAAGRLQIILVEYEPPPAPIHIVHPEGRYLPAKVRLFIDYAAERLRRKFAP